MTMRRREMIEILLGTAGAAVAVPGLAAEHPFQSHVHDHTAIAQADARATAADWKPEFLGAHEFKTLDSLAERILPGASKTKTAQFIDQLLAVESEGNRRDFMNALGAFERRALEQTRRSWVALSPSEQEAILTEASTMESGVPIEQPWAPGRPAEVAQPPVREIRLTLRDHFELLKGWIAGSYYSSEIGMKELGWTGNLFHNSFPGCQHPGGHP